MRRILCRMGESSPDPQPEEGECSCEGGMVDILMSHSSGAGANVSVNEGDVHDPRSRSC